MHRPLYSKIIKVTNAVAKQGLPVLAQQEGFGLSHFPVGGSIGYVGLCCGVRFCVFCWQN